MTLRVHACPCGHVIVREPSDLDGRLLWFHTPGGCSCRLDPGCGRPPVHTVPAPPNSAARKYVIPANDPLLNGRETPLIVTPNGGGVALT